MFFVLMRLEDVMFLFGEHDGRKVFDCIVFSSEIGVKMFWVWLIQNCFRVQSLAKFSMEFHFVMRNHYSILDPSKKSLLKSKNK